MFVLLAFILLRLNKPEIKRIDGVAEYVDEERAKLGSLSRAEKNTLIAFCDHSGAVDHAGRRRVDRRHRVRRLRVRQ